MASLSKGALRDLLARICNIDAGLHMDFPWDCKLLLTNLTHKESTSSQGPEAAESGPSFLLPVGLGEISSPQPMQNMPADHSVLQMLPRPYLWHLAAGWMYRRGQHILLHYSETSDKGHSERGQTSKQRINQMYCCIQTLYKITSEREQSLYKDKKLGPKARGGATKYWVVRWGGYHWYVFGTCNVLVRGALRTHVQ